MIDWPEDLLGARALADEMLEDPRSHLVVLAGDETQTIIFTIWDEETIGEVERGVQRLLGPKGNIRRLGVADLGSSDR